MGVDNIIKNSFLNNFSETISLSTVVTTGQMSLVFAAVVYIIYLVTCDKTIYSKTEPTLPSTDSLVLLQNRIQSRE